MEEIIIKSGIIKYNIPITELELFAMMIIQQYENDIRESKREVMSNSSLKVIENLIKLVLNLIMSQMIHQLMKRHINFLKKQKLMLLIFNEKLKLPAIQYHKGF